jgi:hypothetical protein
MATRALLVLHPILVIPNKIINGCCHSEDVLFYDADGGTQAAVQIATVGVNFALTNADFFVS